MIIIRQKMIMRSDCKANPHILYIFGDNLERIGFGGQAKEMRGEPNAFGIVTKRRAAHDDNCYMRDDNKVDWSDVRKDLFILRKSLQEYRGLVIPFDGIGTGLAKLPEYAPRLLAYINEELNKLKEI